MLFQRCDLHGHNLDASFSRHGYRERKREGIVSVLVFFLFPSIFFVKLCVGFMSEDGRLVRYEVSAAPVWLWE